MRRRHKQEAGTPDLGASTVALLLAGWSASPPENVPREHGFTAGFLELYAVDGIATLWRQHETWLRQKAKSWDWVPGFTHNGTAMFYGERAVASGSEDWNVETHD